MEDESKKMETPVAPRRAYVPPRVEESATFEHLVLACGHTSTLSPTCNPKPPPGVPPGTVRS